MEILLRRRHIVAILTLTAAALLAAIANSGSQTPTVEEYYTSLESRLGYWLLLGNARHCGLWESGTMWPFPISKAQRAMEERLYMRLGLHIGSRVLDAGAGSGIVAAYMAEHGLQVQAIDLTPIHVEQAKRNVEARGLGDRISVKSETITISRTSMTPLSMASTLWRLLSMRMILNGCCRTSSACLNQVACSCFMRQISSPIPSPCRRFYGCLTAKNTLEKGAYEQMLEQVGFQDITVEDLTDNVLPLWRFFGILGAVPYDILGLFGLQNRFTNMMAGVETYRHWGQGRYISVKAVKSLSV